MKAVYEKNKDYVPRKEPAKLDRRRKGRKGRSRRMDHDAGRADRGERAAGPGHRFPGNHSWFDMVPALSANKDLKVETLNKLGYQSIGRMNFLHPPFDSPKVRRAAFMAVNQKDFMDAMVGNERHLQHCAARSSSCGSPLETAQGSDAIVKGTGIAEARKLLAVIRL